LRSGPDLDPASPVIDAYLRPLVYRPSTPALWASMALHGFIFSLYHSWISIDADLDPLHWF
jgi:hypothetical protein